MIYWISMFMSIKVSCKKCLPICFLLLFLNSSVSASDSFYIWDDFHNDFYKQLKVCHNKPVHVKVDLPEDFLVSHEEIILGLEITSKSYKISNKEKGHSFELFTPWVKINDSLFSGYKIPVTSFPAIQKQTVELKAKYFKPGENIFEISHGWRSDSSNCKSDCCGFVISHLYFKDAPPPASFNLAVYATPADAEIFINDSYKGKSPVKIDVEKGVYNVVVKKEGYAEYQRTVRFPEDNTYQPVVLEKIQHGDITSPPPDVSSPERISGVAKTEYEQKSAASEAAEPSSPHIQGAETQIVKTKTSKRVALVVGNASYSVAPLKNPVNDAADIATALNQLGFIVIKKIDADQRGMDEAMASFYKKLQQAEVGLFYYAGHGMQIDGVNYLIPVKSTILNPSDVKYKAFDARRVLGMMQDAGNRLNVVILDACRNNPFRNYFRSQQQGLAFMDAPDGTIVAYATAPGSVAVDGSGRNGLYTSYLLKNLIRPDLTVLELFNRTGLDVKNASQSRQTPWMTNSPMETYYLAGDNQEMLESE